MAGRTKEQVVTVQMPNGSPSRLEGRPPERLTTPTDLYGYVSYSGINPWVMGEAVLLTGLARQEPFNLKPNARIAVTLIEASLHPDIKPTAKTIRYAEQFVPEHWMQPPWTWWWDKIGTDQAVKITHTTIPDHRDRPLFALTVVSFANAIHANMHLTEQVKTAGLKLKEAHYRQLLAPFGVIG